MCTWSSTGCSHWLSKDQSFHSASLIWLTAPIFVIKLINLLSLSKTHRGSTFPQAQHPSFLPQFDLLSSNLRGQVFFFLPLFKWIIHSLPNLPVLRLYYRLFSHILLILTPFSCGVNVYWLFNFSQLLNKHYTAVIAATVLMSDPVLAAG